MVSLALGIIGYLLIMLRWRYGADIWESVYTVANGLSMGMALNALFVAMTASAPGAQRTTAISFYYLCQQIGIIFGVGGFAALFDTIFRNALRDGLDNVPEKTWVSHSELGLLDFAIIPVGPQADRMLSAH